MFSQLAKRSSRQQSAIFPAKKMALDSIRNASELQCIKFRYRTESTHCSTLQWRCARWTLPSSLPKFPIDHNEIGGKFEVSASTACEKINTAGTDENPFRLEPMPGHGAQVLPLKLVPVPVRVTKLVYLHFFK